MNLNEFAKEVHALAVEKGFYETEPEVEIPEGDFKSAYRPTARFNSEGFESGASDVELIAAIHSEISEAFEEWRAGRPMVWHKCRYSDLPCAGKGCNSRNVDCENVAGQEPHGIAVELIDVVLRLLDAAAAWNVEIGQINNVPLDILKKNVPEFVVLLHFEITYGRITTVISHIMEWIRTQGIDPEALLLEKHEYNKTRPYRHGGKRV